MADDLSWMNAVPNAAMAPEPAPQQAGPIPATDHSWMSAVPNAVDPAATHPKGSGIVANLGAGTSDTTAAFLGAPVDLATGALNLGIRGINSLASAVSPKKRSGFFQNYPEGIPPIEKPVGGSDFFRSAFGYIGADPRNVTAPTGSEQIARAAGGGAASMLLPWAGARSLPALAGSAGAVQQALGSGSAAQMARMGAEAGAGGQLASDAVPEPYKPIANLAGSMIGAAIEPMAGLAGSAAIRGAGSVPPISTMKPILSTNAKETSVGKTLTGLVDNAPLETSPVGPLNLAQATNNPEIAARVDLAPSYNATANAALLKAQQEGIQKQIGQIGAPATAADASSAFTGALRQGRQVAGSEENRLWTVPELADKQVTATPVRESVNSAVQALDPVLRENMSPQLQALVNKLNRAPQGTTADLPGAATARKFPLNAAETTPAPVVPPRTSVRDLNGIRSDLETIARSTSDGTERSIARTLSSAFLDGLDKVPEITGTPAVTRLKYEAVPAGMDNPTIEVKAATAANPEILKAYQTARDYTRQMRTMFGAPDSAGLLNKNSAGVFTKDPSEGARSFFNFSNGSPEGPQSIAQLSDFVGQLKSQPMAPQVAGQMKDAARSYVASALTKAARAEEGSNFNAKTMQDFLRTNGPWIEKSGLFEQPQIDAAKQLMEYGDMLRRPEQLLRQTNSATQPRTARQGTFVDQIMNPAARHIIEAGGALTGAHQHGVIGGAIGMMIGGGFEKAVAGAEGAMRELMAQALLDPSVAKGLMMKASAGNRLLMAPTARQAIDTARAAISASLAAEQTHPQNQTTPPPSARSAVQ